MKPLTWTCSKCPKFVAMEHPREPSLEELAQQTKFYQLEHAKECDGTVSANHTPLTTA